MAGTPGRMVAALVVLGLSAAGAAGQSGADGRMQQLAGGRAKSLAPKPGQMVVSAGRLGVAVNPVRVGPNVYRLGPGPNPAQLELNITTNVNAADTTNADQLRLGGGLGLDLTGAGLIVGIWDGGDVRSTHQELTGRITVVDGAGISDHATHVAGTIGATGVVSSARGMASLIAIRSRDFNNDLAEMTTDAGLIDLSNHSYSDIRGWDTRIDWGIGPVDTWFADRSVDAVEDRGFGKYHSGARSLDQVLASNPHLLSVWAAANDCGDHYTDAGGYNDYVTYFSSDPGGGWWDGSGWYLVANDASTPAPPGDGNAGTGYDCLPGDQTAKNNLVVGAIYDITADPYDAGNVVMASFSSRGPVDDGRVKPDAVANGVSLYSCLGSSNSAYGSYSGTSMATPNTCGTAGLVHEHYADLHGGASPASATLKGLVVHTAFDAGNAGPDYKHGWGVVDAAAAAVFLDDATSGSPAEHHLVEETYTGTPQDVAVSSDGTVPLKATVVWTDPAPAGLPGSGLDDGTSVLVHDLDLTVVGPPGATSYFPWTLNAANPSASAVRTVPNDVDNVEQVLIDAPPAGVYTVRVSHTGGAFTQAYTLLISGATIDETPPVVQSESPARGSMVVDLASVEVTFSEAVTGVAPGDLTVNGSPAVSVMGSGAGPYAFTGYAAAPDGTVNVVLAGGSIEDLAGNPFAGDAWAYELASEDCNGNGIVDACDLDCGLPGCDLPGCGESTDGNGNGLPDECDPRITAWRSVRTHAGAGDLSIALDPSATGYGLTNEPRRDGLQRLEVDFDADVSDSLSGTVEAEDLTNGGSIPATGQDTINGGTTLVIEFRFANPAYPPTLPEFFGLPDQACYRVDLTAHVAYLMDDADCRFRVLAGDVNGEDPPYGDGKTDLTDAAHIKLMNGTPLAGDDVRFDVNLDGLIDLTDTALLKDLNGGEAVCP